MEHVGVALRPLRSHRWTLVCAGRAVPSTEHTLESTGRRFSSHRSKLMRGGSAASAAQATREASTAAVVQQRQDAQHAAELQAWQRQEALSAFAGV
jgi:hypothetical protein